MNIELHLWGPIEAKLAKEIFSEFAALSDARYAMRHSTEAEKERYRMHSDLCLELRHRIEKAEKP